MKLQYNTGTYARTDAVKISIDELRSQPQQRMLIGFREALAGLEAVKPVVGDIVVSLGSWGVHISGRVTTLLKLTCHRCLRAYFQTLYVDIDERLVHDVDDKVTRRELTRDDFVEPIPVNGILDISDLVYQAVTLAAPTCCLCGADCPGPPVAEWAGNGSPLVRDNLEGGRVDPRWKNLKTLFPKEDSGEKS